LAGSDVAGAAGNVVDVELPSEILADFWAMTRANTSVGPPGANPTIKRTGRVG
jgi:hypothetical protein